MAKKIKITENQLERIVKNIISEQDVAGYDNYKKAEKIAYNLAFYSQGAGTINSYFVDNVYDIDSVDVYNIVNKILPNYQTFDNLDFVGLVNDEFNPQEEDDARDLKKMQNHFKTIGITMNIGTDSVSITIPEKTKTDDKQGGNDQTIGTPTDLEMWIKNSGMECVRLGSPSGPYNLGKGGPFIQFSLGNNVYVAIYQDKNARYYNYANTNELDKRVTAQCNSAGMIELLEAGQVIRTFDPKNPEGGASKGGQVKPKTTLRQATSTQDIKDKKGFVYSGMKGPVVGEIQNLINQGSTNTDQITVSNTFDNETIQKVKQIQTSMNLKADGIIGPLTYEKLQQRVRFNVKDTNVSQVKPAEISKPTGTVQVPQPGPLPIQEQVNKFKKILNYGKKGVK